MNVLADPREARDVAQVLLSGLPERWQHTVGVARRAEEVSVTVRADAPVLVAAAWLHDIGYAPVLRHTGFHPLDGARHLLANGWPARIAGLVAHHSEAYCVAQVQGLAGEFDTYPWERSAVSDALTYADQTMGPHGHPMTIEQRMADMLRRHGPGSANTAAHAQRAPRLLASVRRVEQRLAALRSVSAV